MKKFKIFILLLSVTFIGCHNQNRSPEGEVKFTSKDTTSSILSYEFKDSSDSESTEIADSLFSTRLLTEGVFHNDEVWPKAANEEWFGLFQNQQGYYLAKTKLELTQVNDPISEEDNLSGWQVKTASKDTSLVLIKTMNYLTPRKIQKIEVPKSNVYPQDTLKLNYMGNNYQIYATGEKIKLSDQPDIYEVKNYKLFITTRIHGKIRKTLLVSVEEFDDTMVSILFVGDMDGDGILDLLLDTSNHYNSERTTLYLSKPATNNELLMLVGKHTIIGC